jgi:hypothetical protein
MTVRVEGLEEPRHCAFACSNPGIYLVTSKPADLVLCAEHFRALSPWIASQV